MGSTDDFNEAELQEKPQHNLFSGWLLDRSNRSNPGNVQDDVLLQVPAQNQFMIRKPNTTYTNSEL